MCDLWHPVWLDVAQQARAKPGDVLAIRTVLERDSQIAALSIEHQARIIARGLRYRAELVRAVLETITAAGLVHDGRVISSLPAPTDAQLAEIGYSQNPEAIRKRRYRAQLQANGRDKSRTMGHKHQMSHEMGQSGANVPPLSVPMSRVTDYKPTPFQTLGVPSLAANVPRDVRDDVPPLLRNVNQDIRKKHAFERETVPSARASGASVITDPSQLTREQSVRWRWVQARLRQAQDELEPHRWAELIEALPDQLVLSYAQGRCRLPLKPYQVLNQLDAKRRGREPQQEMTLGPVGVVKGDGLIRAAERPDVPLPVLKSVSR